MAKKKNRNVMVIIGVILVLAFLFFIASYNPPAGTVIGAGNTIQKDSQYYSNYQQMMDCRDNGGEWNKNSCDYSRRIG